MGTSSFIQNHGENLRPHSFNEKENRCRAIFEDALRQGRSFWHVCTPGNSQYIIFDSPEDYKFGTILAAVCSYDAGVRIITFELMSNHVHFLLDCSGKEDASSFLDLYRKRLTKYFQTNGKSRDFRDFNADPIPITTLESLRNQICYTNRNNFVVDPDQTPFSFPYGANAYYFNPFAKSRRGELFGDLSDRAKIRLLHSKRIDYPGSYLVTDGYFSPVSFCDIAFGESVFRDARHYMFKLSRDLESYKELAESLGDQVYYTDDELVGIVYSICNKRYSQDKPSMLTFSQKNELARTLHFDYKADNAKISRILHIPVTTLDSLFPMSISNKR